MSALTPSQEVEAIDRAIEEIPALELTAEQAIGHTRASEARLSAALQNTGATQTGAEVVAERQAAQAEHDAAKIDEHRATASLSRALSNAHARQMTMATRLQAVFTEQMDKALEESKALFRELLHERVASVFEIDEIAKKARSYFEPKMALGKCRDLAGGSRATNLSTLKANQAALQNIISALN